MIPIIAIVEGEGEVQAFPVLLRRLANWLSPTVSVNVLPPIRVRKDRFLNKNEEFSRFLRLAEAKVDRDGWILILLDADDDCPAELTARVLKEAKEILHRARLSIVIANREYEAWFIAAASSLDGKRGFNLVSNESFEPEQGRNAKGWIERHMASMKYHEMTDQPAFSAIMSLDQARENSRSFRKLCKEWIRNVGTVES